MGELLTSLPLTDASTRKQKKDIEEPKGWLKKLQGLFTTDRDNFLKTCQGPFKSWDATVSGGLPIKKGVCYFIHAILMHSRTINTDTCTGITGTGQIGGTYTIWTLPIVPLVAGSWTRELYPDVLLDEETTVVIASLVAAPTTSSVIFSYAEVPC